MPRPLETEPQSEFDDTHRLHRRKTHLAFAVDMAQESGLARGFLRGRERGAGVDDGESAGIGWAEVLY
jgi:hypothetical protein